MYHGFKPRRFDDANHGTGAGAPPPGQQREAEEGKPSEKTLTQSDVDRIVEERLSRERKGFEKTLALKLAEAEKLARMTAEEKAEHERIQGEAQLMAREAAITKRELKAQAMEALAEKGLPRELIDSIPLLDPEGVKSSLSQVEKAFRAAVQRGVEDRMKGVPPARQTGGQPGAMTTTEKMKLKAEQPLAYEKIFGGQ